MKTTVESVNSVQKRINIEVDKDDVNKAFSAVYRSFAKDAHLKGFRPGKAPLSLIRQVYKPQAMEKVLEKILKEHLFSAIEQENLSMISQPVVEKVGTLDEGQNFNFDALVDIYPEFALPDFSSISVSYNEYKDSDELYKSTLDDTLRNFATTKEVSEGKPSKGHLVYCSQKGFQSDGTEIGELQFSHQPIELDGNQLLPEIENAFFEMAIGDKKEVNLSLPADYPDDELAGKDVKMEIELHGVYELDIPELSDEVAKKAGLESAAQLEENIKNSITLRLENMTKNDKEMKVLEKLRSLCEFEVPPSVVDKSIDDIIYEFYGQQVKDQSQIQQLLENKELRNNLKKEAQIRAARSLILLQVLKTHELKAEDEDFESFASGPEFNFKNDYDKKQFIKKNKNAIADQVLMRKAMDTIYKNAVLTPVETNLKSFRDAAPGQSA